jgi:ComF family protein
MITQSYNEIIPVPLYKTRSRERGYNQSEAIANAMAKIFNLPVKNEHLLRIRPTSSQTKMSKEEREKNVKNVFHSPKKLHGRRILLIDDVITTGSTTEACLKTLKGAGANSVDVFVIAHPQLIKS